MTATSPKYTQKPFPEALGELLRAREDADALGRINLRRFFAEITGWSYEYLRLMVMGERPLLPEVIEAMASALGVAPEYFVEYRLWQIQEGLKRHPKVACEAYEMLMASFALLDKEADTTPVRERRRRRSGRVKLGPPET